MWRPPPWQITSPGAQDFSAQAHQQQFHSGFQTPIPQAARMQSVITSPGGVPSLQHLGSSSKFHGPFNPATVCHSPPRGITLPVSSTAQLSNNWSPLQQPSPLPSPRGVPSPVHRPLMPTTLPSPRGSPSQVLQSSPFNSASWQVRNPQPSVFCLNQGPSFVASTSPSPRHLPSPAQQLFVSSTLLPPRGAPSPTQQPPMSRGIPSSPAQQLFVSSTLLPPRGAPSPTQQPPMSRGIPSSPVQQPFVSSTLPFPGRMMSPVQQPFMPGPTVFSPRGVPSPVLQSSPFNSPSWQVRNPHPNGFSPNQRPSVVASFPQPYLSPTLPSPRGIPSPIQQQFIPSTVPSPRGVPSPVLQSLPPWQLRNPQLSGYNLNQGPSALDRHIQEKQLRDVSSHVQQFNNSVSSGLPQPWKESALQMPIAMSGHSINVPRPPVSQQFSPVKKRMSDFSPDRRPLGGKRTPSPSTPYRKTGFHRDRERGREQGSRRNYSPSVGDRSSPRVSRCFSPPPPDVERVIKCVVSEEYYIKEHNEQDDNYCTVRGTEKLTELQTRFEKEILNMASLEDDVDNDSVSSRRSNHSETDVSDVESLDSEDNDNPPKSRLRRKSNVSNYAEFLGISDEEINSDEDSSEIGSQGLSGSSSESDNDGDDDDDDEGSNHENGGIDDDDKDLPGHDHEHKAPSVAPSVTEIRKRKIGDPKRLHPELWFNEAGETNDGPVCRCSATDRQQGIRHGIYPGETVIASCDPLTNNVDKLHHYWVAVTPHTNFMTENPTVIHSEGKDYTFEGFSMFCHHPLEQVPLCSVIRFNIEYSLHFISQPVPENFCIKDLDLFSQFLFHKMLELADWDLNGNIQDSCQRYHFMPDLFIDVQANPDNSKKEHELLPMSHVLSHVLDSAEPLKKFSADSADKEEYNKMLTNSIVMNPNKKPACLRVDDLQFCKDVERLSKGKMYPYIVHHSIRPVQMSFAGDPKYQKLQKSYVKLRNLISNTPVPSRKNQDKLVKLKIDLEKMRLTSSMRRDVVIEVSSRGMIKTGLKSDVCQHALLLPVLVHHVRYHMCLQTLDKKMGYVFKDRSLFQLALTHPSYHLNFGMNPDHARNSLSNCGVKQPRYGDRKIRHLHTRKKGITQLIRVMSNLGKMEEYQSMIRHNERLEFLGDAVLELISSVHLYFMLPSQPEGGLAMYRSALVQNKHLAQLAKKLGLSDYMQFSHGPDLCVEEDLNHAMANCFEALLGAMYLESGLTSTTVLFTNLAFDEEELRDVWTNLPKHPLQTQQPDGDRHLIGSSSILQKLEEFEKASGIEFNHIRLLARAFTHPQVGFNNLTLGSNQRMEFLGDSVLQFVVSVYLFQHFPEHHEGHLTGIKAFREKLLADILEAFVAALYVDKGLRYVEMFCRVCLFPRLEGKTPDLPQYKVLHDKGPALITSTIQLLFTTREGDWDLVKAKAFNKQKWPQQKMPWPLAEDNVTIDENMRLGRDYFPELARQKRLLDRKHQGRRRNYWNKLPRNEREKDEQGEDDVEVEPRWEEKEAFEEDEDIDAKQDDDHSQ
ncbi:hypothetical protein OS493_019765 [Desmophyllum pertusum]|uniref:RNase III domain-containing protein n=1 Tax=Desmophyllum pertusum TaxID=174260 RepID=A0A9W9YZN0_9CNID|nr:hypothetical protein OS493_019765 [Desmophyllum pertusum]